ncbi:FkbM family methyltransferase [Falsiroseomonas stagni]|uniref:Methyltransferase, FkbM family n=1 Tax=Falsiroseomonas stagni DSM 19981 TaxID=1123062 RepID=A0A1I4E1C6_9PROT|nr:FkbM family methyltransferase [Falsiroseomonas stagni]SFK99023.1 methyltransferase, FkbM family [Falsiroseomonas stagni DSM 19981]
MGAGDALFRLEPEDFANPWRRVRMQALIRAHARAVPLPDGVVLCRALGRYPLVVEGRDLGLSARLMIEGFWDYAVVSFIARVLRPGQVAIDAGANLGFLTVLMADMVGPAGRVEAVEPNAALAGLAGRNLVMNGLADRVRIHQAAAADRGGEVRWLRLDTADPKNGHLLPPGSRPAGGGGTVTEAEVPTLRLDDLAPGAVDFVKIDVEGAEEAVWAGMQGLLDRSPDVLVLMEFNRDRGQDPAALLHAIAARFPLRHLRADARVAPLSLAEALARDGDIQLVLARRARL